MRISTSYNQIAALLSAYPNATGSQSGQTGTQTTATSSFGPDALLSIGGTTSSLSDTGYSHLFPKASQSQSTGLASYDLASVLSASAPSATAAKMSSKEQKEEAHVIEQALAHMDAAEYAQAKTLLNDHLDDHPNSAVAVHALGAVALEEQDYEQAEQLFMRAHFLAPEMAYNTDADNARILQEDDDTVLGRAQRLVSNSQTRGDGIRLLVALTDRSPTNAEGLMLLAENLIIQGDAVNGLSKYFSAVRVADTEQLGRVETELAELIEIAPQAAYLRQLLGRAQLRQEKYEQAAETLTAATGLSDSNDSTKADLALAYVGLGRERLAHRDVSGAMTHFEHAKQLDRDGVEVQTAMAEGYAARAELRTRLGNLKDAAIDYKAAAQELGTNGDDSVRERIARGAFALGIVLEQRRTAAGEDIDEEALAFQVAYDMDPDNTTHKSKLARTRDALGDQYLADEKFEAAAAAYRQALDLDRNNTQYKASTVSAYKLAGEYLLSRNKYDRAISVYHSALRVDPNDSTVPLALAGAYNARGVHYRDLGKFSLAATDFKEALHFDPGNTTYQDNYNTVRNYPH